MTKRMKKRKKSNCGGRASREKGFAFEREVVNFAKEAGFTARRAWGSNGNVLGLAEGVDVLIEHNYNWKLQAKRVGKIAAYLRRPEGTDGVVVREDHGEALIVLPLAVFLKLAIGESPDGRQDREPEPGTVLKVRGTQTSARIVDKGDRSAGRRDEPFVRHGALDRNP